MSSSPDYGNGINGLLYYVILEDVERSKRRFTKTVSLTLNQVSEEEVRFTSERNNCKGGERCGDLLE